MARKKAPPPTSYQIPESQLLSNLLRYPKDGGPPVPRACCQIPEWTLGPPDDEDPIVTVDASHLCRISGANTLPAHTKYGYLYWTESGWHAHKHRLLGKITQAQIDELDVQFVAYFASLREAATKQRDKLRQQIADLEAYWPHLRDGTP